MDPNSQNPTPAPAAPPADNTPPATPPAGNEPPATPPVADPTPAPKTVDPVDHSKQADPAPETPPADPANPNDIPPPADPETPPEDADPTAGDLVGDATPDEMEAAIQQKLEAGEDLPNGINPDGTIDPLVYAYENMPTITVVGKDGVKGELKKFEVKTAEDLPDDFRFANAKEQAKFASSLQQNMNVAKDLMADAQSFNEKRITETEKRNTLVAQKTELDSLIKEGLMPEIKGKPTDANFMDDPGAQRAQQVLDHMKKMNEDFEKAGIAQRITSVKLALRDLEAQEAIEARDKRMGVIKDTRNDINGKISNGNNSAPAAPQTEQRVHKNVNDALRFARKQHGI